MLDYGAVDPLVRGGRHPRRPEAALGCRMTALRDARQQVADALEVVLPGRVNAYATTRMQRNVAPYMWIESPRADPESVGRSSQLWVAVFPVRIVVDGATHAAMAMLDDLIGGVIDAVDGIVGMQARHVEPGDVYVDSNHVLRGATVDVAVTITARTFCPTEPTVATVPPTPIPVPA